MATPHVEPAPAPERVRIPGWLPPVVYGVVTLLIFRAFAFTDAMLFGSDTLGLGYVARAFFAERLAAGDFPGWNPLLLGGTPFLDSLAGGDSLYPPSLLLLLLLETYRSLGWKLALHVFAAGLFTYGWARALGRSRAAALLAGLAYLVAPFFVTLVWPGHDGKMFVTALTPLLFWAVEAWFARGRLVALAGVAAVVALVLLTTHFQMAYFLFGATGAYAIWRTVTLARGPQISGARAAGVFGAFLAAAVVGAAAAGVQVVPAFAYVTEHSRRTATTTAADEGANRAYASSWSLHPEEAVATLLAPEFVGSNVGGAAWTSDTYWGRNVFKHNHEYVGLAVLVLAALAFVGPAKPRSRWFFLGMGALALLYALGTHTPVWRLSYAVLPGIDLFRAPSMAIFLTGFAAVTLMAYGIDHVLAWTAGEDREAGARAQKGVWIAAGVVGVLMLLAASGTLTSIWTSWFRPGLEEGPRQALERAQPFIGRGFLTATALVAVVGGTLLLGRRGALRPSGVVAVLALVVALDGLRVDAPFVTTQDFEAYAAPDPNAGFLLDRQAESAEPFRVLDMGGRGQEVRLGMFGLELAGGHHPNDLARYRELIGMAGSEEPRFLLASPNVQRLLNVEYLVWPTIQYGPFEETGLPIAGEGVSATQLQDGRLYEVVYRMDALPRARLVSQAAVVPGLAAVDTILDPAFDPALRAVLPGAPPLELGGGTPEGEVTWLERTPDRQLLRVRTDRNALLVIADNWFPAWEAAVDGEPAPLLRAYHTLRAVPLTAGEHDVELRYAWGRPVRAGAFVSLVAWLAIATFAGLSWLLRRRAAGG